MSESRYLPEVGEADAQENVAVIFEEIRRVVGVPFVALIYRFLAVTPELLERCWAEVAPNLTSEYGQSATAELARVSIDGIPPIPRAAVAVTGLDGKLAAATLFAYRRANGANILAMAALLDGVPTGSATASAAVRLPEPAKDPILPMVDLRALHPVVTRLLEEISAPIAGTELPRVVPSLLRHLAHDPCLLALLWTALRPTLMSTEFIRTADQVSAHAREFAAGLPYRVRRLANPVQRSIVKRFVVATIPRMLVTGSALESALGEVLERCP